MSIIFNESLNFRLAKSDTGFDAAFFEIDNGDSSFVVDILLGENSVDIFPLIGKFLNHEFFKSVW